MRRMAQDPRPRKSAKAIAQAKLRTARNRALKSGNQAEADRLEGELTRLTFATTDTPF